ncbi:MAG TPA: protocatechuate 3,4-dioxygenase [Novosphingobium sp.]|nr:protocatechuate 3,4-dioxygenase [Novosphingobium sp.]
MAKLVGGFLMPHLPTIPSGALLDDAAAKARVYGAFDAITQRLKELAVDTVIIIGDDHYENFGPHCIPTCLIVTGDIDVSDHVELLGMPKGAIPNNAPLAQHIIETGYDDGIDWSFAKFLGVDHSIAVPYTMTARKLPGVRIVPVYINAVVAPVIRSRRAAELGQSIRRAVESFPGDDRVAVFGTGGISHWVGSPGMGRINEDFDHKVMAMVEAGDIEGLIALPDEVVLQEAGNGAIEIKNWICAMAAVPEARGLAIAYEPVPQWITGCGFAELKLAA